MVGLPDETEIDILPYHRAATAGYLKLCINYPSASFPDVGEETVQRARTILENIGLTVRRGD
jgi:hypothetical protein